MGSLFFFLFFVAKTAFPGTVTVTTLATDRSLGAMSFIGQGPLAFVAADAIGVAVRTTRFSTDCRWLNAFETG